MKIFVLIPLSLLLVSSSTNILEKNINDSYAIDSVGVNDFIVEFAQEGLYSEEDLNSFFSNTIIRKKKIIMAQKNQPEKKTSWLNYKNSIVSNSRIQAGKLFMLKNHHSLSKAELLYNVDKEIIVAILGVESSYGFKKGKYRAIDSLSTMAFEYYPRGNFYKKELKEFFRYTKSNNINVFSINSSWAGAIGYPQFIPSSINHYAFDFNNDGTIDLVNSIDDAIGSIANYLIKNGYKKEDYYFDKIDNENLIISTGLTVDKDCSDIKLDEKYCKDNFKVFKLDKDYYVGGRIFYSITKYNRSNMYAAAVLEIAKSLKD